MSTLTLDETRRYARQIALPEVGPQGQARLRDARVVIVTGASGDASGTSASASAPVAATAEYLTAAGVGSVEVIGPPGDPADWLAALQGANLVVRFAFDDDPLLKTAIHLGLPALFAMAGRDEVDLFAFRRHGPCPHGNRAVAPRAAASDPAPGAAAVVAAGLVASEALWLIVHPDEGPRARLLRLPLAGGQPVVQELPWTPECFMCGGSSPEANFS